MQWFKLFYIQCIIEIQGVYLQIDFKMIKVKKSIIIICDY